MKFEVMNNFTVKSLDGIKHLRKGQIIKLPEASAKQLIEAGKVKPLPFLDNEALNERMAIMGENTEPEQTKPYVTNFGVLVIPYNSDKKYHYWKGGQGVCATLKELGRCDLIEKYKSLYIDN